MARILNGKIVTVEADIARLLWMHGWGSNEEQAIQGTIMGCNTMIDEYPEEVAHWTEIKMILNQGEL